MLQATPSGQLVVSHELNAPICSELAVCTLSYIPDLFNLSLLIYGYGINELRTFLISSFHLIPLLLSGRARSDGGSRLIFKRSEAALILRWGLAVGYTPRLDIHKRTAILYLREMSGTYRSQLLRFETHRLSKGLLSNQYVLTRGLGYFRACVELNLRKVEASIPSPSGDIPVADRLLMGLHIVGGVVRYMECVSTTLFAGSRTNCSRYYNSFNLESVQVDFWDWANITIHSQPEVYFQESYIQEILR
nr:MAG: P0 protein [Panicum distortion mosaic virus]